MAKDTKQNNNASSKMRKPRFNLSWLYLFLLAGIAYVFLTKSGNSSTKQLSYTDFQACLDSGFVKEIMVNKDYLTLKFSVDTKGEKYIYGDVSKQQTPRIPVVEFGSVSSLENKIDSARFHGKFSGKVSYERDDNTLWNILLQIGPLILLVVFWFFIMNRMGGGGMGGSIFNFGKSKAKLFDQNGTTTKVTFKDVAGQTEAKREVHEIVDFLKNPKKYTELGGKIPKGALLVGPPGTGKTLLAKAVAGEADVPFFSMSGSDFVEMFVGVGASRVRDLFQQAKEKSPCIIFIDEIDAIGRARGNKASIGGNDERENTLNQLLTEMDGFGTNSGIIILAATNRADVLDKALLRAGRFDRQIHVDLPDLNERKAIFNVHLRPIKIDETVDVDMLARQTPGFSGADIANVCNEAALIAARNNSAWVNKQCFLDAVDRIIGGLEKKTKVMTADEKRAIALHEAGHATISWFCQYANPLVKVTIVPRGQALGAAWYMPEERQITTKEEMLDDICATLGGRAAEELCIGKISTGAMNDLEKVTKRSYGMIAYAGMSEAIPNLCYYNNEEYAFTKPYSEHTAQLIDEEVKKLIAEQYARAKQILTEHKEGHEELAQLLIDREVIYAEDVERIFGKRPWVSRTEEILAANAQITPPSSNDGTDHSAENEEFIRKKVVEAVVEKAKKGELAKDKAGENGQPKEEKHEPKQFHELKVTTHETPSMNEGIVAQAVQKDIEETATEANPDDTDAMEPFELLDPIETTEDKSTEQPEDIQYIAPAQPESKEKPAEEKAPETPSQPTSDAADSQEKTLFGW
ncbi:MAG: ATP-dependent zinc metalloprotease FtsH [Bacteroidaceae bacterium]|nr:ATP-dependent zinc metalloprotease FtsH [Bacteroidaceae bacterium]